MWDKGMSYKEITQFLNDNNYRTPQNLNYTYSNVVMTLQKYLRRLERVNSEDTVISESVLCVRSIKILRNI